MDFEVNLLLDLGFEVFVPKILSKCAPRSSSISFEFDKSLTIPKNILEKLNSYNFYQDTIDSDVINILNKYFDVVFIANIYPQVLNFAANYKNKLIIRAFGYEGNKDYEIATVPFKTKRQNNRMQKIIVKLTRPKEICHDNNITRAFYKIRKRLFLGVAYKELIDFEKEFFKNRSVFLPIGIGKKTTNNSNIWTGGNNKILFVCPNIENHYYKNIYKNFTDNFSSQDYIIAGKQEKEYPDDKRITGYLKNSEYLDLFKTSNVMFYHSQEKRHLHYYPLEAIVYGMPLIYMAGGLLESFGGENQPGMAKTIEEAKEKIDRILGGDEDFINEIKEKQVKILDEFKYDYIKSEWEKNFLPIVKGV